MSRLQVNQSATPPNVERESFAIDFTEALQAARRHPIFISACTIIGALALGVYSARQPKVYRAVTALLIEPKLPKILGGGFDEDLGALATTFMTTQFQIIQSRAVYQDVVKRLKLIDDADFKKQHGMENITDRKKRLKLAEGILQRSLRVVKQKRSHIVKLVIEDFDPNRAARIANMVAQSYIDVSLERRLHSTRQATTWLDNRVDEFTQNIEGAEQDLAAFKETHMLISNSVEDRKSRITSGLDKLNDDLLQIRIKLIALESEQAVIEESIGSGEISDAMASIPRIHDSLKVQNLGNQLIALEQKRTSLSGRYGEQHPQMHSIYRQIAQLKTVRGQEIEIILKALTNEISILNKREILVQTEMRKHRRKAQTLNTIALEYSKLSRQLSTHQQTYKSLLKRRMETDLLGQLESNFVSFHQTAEPSPSPIRPNIPIQTSFGAILGLLLGLVITVGSALLDKTIHSQIDIEHSLQITFLGLIPVIEDDSVNTKQTLSQAKEVNSRDFFIVQHPKSGVAECARSLRTNLLFLGAEKPLRRLLVTSPGPSEGKSTAAITLGVTMAQTGSKVLIIDTDLRRPRLHKTFGISGKMGLTSLLLDTTDKSATIKSTDIPRLDVLPCGPLPPNPSELLHTEKFATILKELEETYDLIIFDSPPVNLVTDASILSQITDGTILVVKASKTTRDSARRAARMLNDVKANVLGVVLNSVDLKQGGYYRDHYYQYYRSGGYSYGSDAEGQAKV